MLVSERIMDINSLFIQDKPIQRPNQETKFSSFMKNNEDQVEDKGFTTSKGEIYREILQKDKKTNKIAEEIIPILGLENIVNSQVKIQELLSILEELDISLDDMNMLASEKGVSLEELLVTNNLGEILSEFLSEEEMFSMLLEDGFSDTIQNFTETQKDLRESVGENNLGENNKDIFKQDIQIQEEGPEIFTEKIETDKNQVTDSAVKDSLVSSLVEEKEIVGTDSKANNKNSESDFGFENLNQNFIEKLSEIIDTDSLDEVDQTKLVKQIVDEMKIFVREDVSKLEMQLYPEHLGKITIQLLAKSGVITAQLAAENQLVKEAIESQLFILKQNLQEQGVEVSAIEVVIASKEFENERNKEGNETDSQVKKKNKKIQELNYEETQDRVELTENQVLEQHGSTISYSV